MTQKPVFLFAVVALILVAIAGFDARGGLEGQGTTYALGALVGGFAGFALYHASFGFTAAWRRMSRERRGRGLRAQMVLIGLTCAVTYLLIGFEDHIGVNMHPVVMPMGLSSALGALVFGIGMQMGGGCASGTLFTSGGGSSRMIIVLAFFILGSVWATQHIPGFWRQLPEMTGVPNLPRTSLITEFGPLGAVAALFGFCGLVIWGSRFVERKAHGDLEDTAPTQSLIHGKWSLLAGAVALAIVGVLCFVIFQRPWGVTAGFALWGAKILHGVGVPVNEWAYWQGWRANQLEGSVFANRTSLMNFGIVFGAMGAAALAGRFKPTLKLSRRDVLTAIVGGLLMGYGARLSFGCNIGAYLGGIVSGSLHGWWWLVWGFAGSLIGTRMRGVLEMDPPLAPRRAVT